MADLIAIVLGSYLALIVLVFVVSSNKLVQECCADIGRAWAAYLRWHKSITDRMDVWIARPTGFAAHLAAKRQRRRQP